MKAAVMEAFGEPLKIHQDWPDPECGPNDVVLEVNPCGICRSDYTLWNGGMTWMGIVPPLPSVLVHEYCVVVEELGREVTGFAKGDRVVSPFCHACGSCEFCDAGHQNVCANLTLPGMHYTGGFASHAKVANADVGSNVMLRCDAMGKSVCPGAAPTDGASLDGEGGVLHVLSTK